MKILVQALGPWSCNTSKSISLTRSLYFVFVPWNGYRLTSPDVPSIRFLCLPGILSAQAPFLLFRLLCLPLSPTVFCFLDSCWVCAYVSLQHCRSFWCEFLFRSGCLVGFCAADPALLGLISIFVGRRFLFLWHGLGATHRVAFGFAPTRSQLKTYVVALSLDMDSLSTVLLIYHSEALLDG